MCVCGGYYSCVDLGDSSTSERSFDQPKATWKEKLWIMLEGVDTVGLRQPILTLVWFAEVCYQKNDVGSLIPALYLSYQHTHLPHTVKKSI